MKALIIEDKEYIRKGLLNLLRLVNFEVDVVGECESVNESVIVAKAVKPELVFLDINLLGGSAFDFLEQTKALSYKVIFITAYEAHALKALKAGAVDYLLKPVDIDELEIALHKVKKQSVSFQQKNLETTKNVWQNDPTKLVLSLYDSFQVIDLNQLMYCESDKGYTTFYCENQKKHLVSKTLKEFEERLNASHFVRPHQSFIVNLKFIDKYEKSGSIYLKNGQKIPVSTRKKDHFLKVFLNWSQNET